MAWEEAAAEIRAEYHQISWNEQVGAYTMAYGSDDLDAAGLRTVLFGAFDPRSDRVRATLDRIGEHLAEGDLVYRYRLDDELRGAERRAQKGLSDFNGLRFFRPTSSWRIRWRGTHVVVTNIDVSRPDIQAT